MRKFCLLIASIIMLGAFAACSQNTQPNDTQQNQNSSNSAVSDSKATGEKKEFVVWIKKNISDATDAELMARLQEYGEKNGCKIVAELIPSSNIVEKYSVAIESGETPDIGMLTDQFINQYHKAGILAPLDDVLADIQAANGELFNAPLQVSTFDNKIYAIPCYSGTQAIFYRKDYLAKAGYTEPPKTWKEFGEVAKAVTQKIKGVYGAGIAYGRCPDTENLSRSVLMANGGGFFNEKGEIAINSPKSIASIKQFTDWYLVDKSVPPTSVNWDDSANNKAYLSGQVAMVANAASIAVALQEPQYQEIAKNTGVALFPAGTDNTSVFCSAIYYGVFKSTADVKTCGDIIKYVMDVNWYKQWMNKVAPSVQPVYTGLKEEAIWQDPINKPFIESVEFQRYMGYPGKFSLAESDIYNSYIMTEIIQKVLVEKVSVEEAVSSQLPKIEKIKAKYN